MAENMSVCLIQRRLVPFHCLDADLLRKPEVEVEDLSTSEVSLQPERKEV